MGYLIPPTTSAVKSEPFRVDHSMVPYPVVASGLGATETAVIQYKIGSGETDADYQAIADASGTLTDTQYQSTIKTVGTFRISKSATAASSGVSVG